MKNGLTIDCSGETLILHHHRALYWPEQQLLLCSDLHLGKEHVFARAGVGIPSGVSESTLQRLSCTIGLFDVKRLIVLGDFFHGVPTPGEPWLEELTQFVTDHSTIDISVVAGNHDSTEAESRVDGRIDWHHTPLNLGPFLFQHEPCEASAHYVIAGHLHPTYRVGGQRRTGLQAPAFWFRRKYAILPAFGEFTGGHRIEPNRSDRIYLSGPECVVPIFRSTKIRSTTQAREKLT